MDLGFRLLLLNLLRLLKYFFLLNLISDTFPQIALILLFPIFFLLTGHSCLFIILNPVENTCQLLFLLPFLPENVDESSFFVKSRIRVEDVAVLVALQSHIFASFVRLLVVLRCVALQVNLVFKKVHYSTAVLHQLVNGHSVEGGRLWGFGLPGHDVCMR